MPALSDVPPQANLAARRSKVCRLKLQLVQSPEWVSGQKLVDWVARQRGTVTSEERLQLYAEACRSIFRGLLSGEFVGERQYPHLVHDGGIVRFGPEQAELARGVWWTGCRDHAGDPVIETEYLREYIRDLWLPTATVRVWLTSMHVQHPPWLMLPSTCTVQSPPAEKSKRDIPRTDYRSADAPLVAKMHDMIVEGRAANPTDAARALADTAYGPAKPESKVVRLTRHYRAWSAARAPNAG